MDPVTIGGTDYTSLCLIVGIAGMVAYALTQLLKVTARDYVQQSGTGSKAKRPWWYAAALRLVSVIFGLSGGVVANLVVGSPLEMLEALGAGSLGGLFCTGIAAMVISQLDKRGIKVPQDTLSLLPAEAEQTKENEDE